MNLSRFINQFFCIVICKVDKRFEDVVKDTARYSVYVSSVSFLHSTRDFHRRIFKKRIYNGKFHLHTLSSSFTCEKVSPSHALDTST